MNKTLRIILFILFSIFIFMATWINIVLSLAFLKIENPIVKAIFEILIILAILFIEYNLINSVGKKLEVALDTKNIHQELTHWRESK